MVAVTFEYAVGGARACVKSKREGNLDQMSNPVQVDLPTGMLSGWNRRMYPRVLMPATLNRADSIEYLWRLASCPFEPDASSA